MTWIATLKGRAFDLLTPRPGDVDFDEIAETLAGLPRFNRHTLRAYSIAEHSCRVADAMPKPLRIHGLLHDAHEFALGDQTTPWREALLAKLPHVAGQVAYALDDMKHNVDEAIYIAAGLPFPVPPDVRALVKRADLQLLATEKRDLMAPCDRPWCEGVEPLPQRIEPWGPAKAKREFLDRLADLTQAAKRASAFA